MKTHHSLNDLNKDNPSNSKPKSLDLENSLNEENNKNNESKDLNDSFYDKFLKEIKKDNKQHQSHQSKNKSPELLKAKKSLGPAPQLKFISKQSLNLKDVKSKFSNLSKRYFPKESSDNNKKDERNDVEPQEIEVKNKAAENTRPVSTQNSKKDAQMLLLQSNKAKQAPKEKNEKECTLEEINRSAFYAVKKSKGWLCCIPIANKARSKSKEKADKG